jgi:uncharacterized membrane protein
VIAAALFTAAGVVLLVMAVLGGMGRLPRNGFAGIRTRKTMASDETWNVGHRAAAGYTAAAGTASIGGGIVALFVADSDAAIVALAIGTAVITVTLVLLATRKAHEVIDAMAASA